jgi:hypothetical protein
MRNWWLLVELRRQAYRLFNIDLGQKILIHLDLGPEEQPLDSYRREELFFGSGLA